jgi:hypothetical protein
VYSIVVISLQSRDQITYYCWKEESYLDQDTSTREKLGRGRERERKLKIERFSLVWRESAL